MNGLACLDDDGPQHGFRQVRTAFQMVFMVFRNPLINLEINRLKQFAVVRGYVYPPRADVTLVGKRLIAPGSPGGGTDIQ